MVPQAPHVPSGTLGLGLPPASAAFKMRQSSMTMASNKVMAGHASTPKPSMPVDPSDPASEVHLGSPVEGLCEEVREDLTRILSLAGDDIHIQKIGHILSTISSLN
jgi:hypothetical protein